MQNRFRKVGLFLFVSAILASGVLGVWWYYKLRTKTILRQERANLLLDITRSLPTGVHDSKVQAFLYERKIAYGVIEPHPTIPGDWVKDDWLADPWYRDTTKTIQANGPWIKAPLATCRMFLEFKFDKEGKLLGYRDQPACR